MSRRTLGLVLLSLSAIALGAACGSSDDNPEPSGTTFSSAGGAAGTGGAAGAGGDAGSAGTAGTGGGGGSGGGACIDKPKTTPEYLNRCTSSQCAAFDNAGRLPLFKDGKLPAIP